MFCQALISAEKSLQKYKKHLEIQHDIFYQQDLVLTLAFISEEESQAIVEKLQIRIDYFISEEIMGTFENIFTKSDSLIEAEEDVQTIEDENIASIQHILQGDLSDSDDDDDIDEEDVDDPQAYNLSDTEGDATEKTSNNDGLLKKIEALNAEMARRKEKAMPQKKENDRESRKKNDDNKEEILSKLAETKKNKKSSSAKIEEIYRFLQDSGSSDEESETTSGVTEGYNLPEHEHVGEVLKPTKDIYDFLQDSEDSGEDEVRPIQVKQEPTTPKKTQKLPTAGTKHDLSLLLDRVVMQTKKSNQIMEQQLSGSAEKKRRLK